jgi:hypothetical protein
MVKVEMPVLEEGNVKHFHDSFFMNGQGFRVGQRTLEGSHVKV